jgi:hypothetical protein
MPPADPDLRRHAEQAIQFLDDALEKSGELGHEGMNRAIGEVIAFGNRVLDAWREGRIDRDLLDRANATTSLAHGTELPLAGLHANRIRQTCEALRDLVKPAERDGPSA